MIKAKKIGLILDREVLLGAQLKDGMVVGVACEFIDADYDRLYLYFPPDKNELAQFFYNERTVSVSLDCLNERKTYDAKVLYEPVDNLIVVEYFELNDIPQNRQSLRVRATKALDVLVADENVSAVTIDISAGGCRFLSPVELETGSVFESYLRLSPLYNPLNLKLNIRNCKYLSVENKYEISAEFIKIKEYDRKNITKFCYEVQAEILREKNLKGQN